MPKYEVTFPAQTFAVEAENPQEAACLAAYELARQCEQGALTLGVEQVGSKRVPFDWPGRIPEAPVT